MEHFKRQLFILDDLTFIGYNWITTYHKGGDRSSLPKILSKYLNFLKTLSYQNIRWVLNWTNCFKPTFRTKSSNFTSLLETQGIMTYSPKRFFRQLGRVQESPPTPNLTSFTVNFDKRNCPNEISMKIPIIEV